jgi:hypothetical protein
MPSPRSSLSALRALSALLLYRILHPVLFLVIIIMVACYVLTVLLALSFSAWWWLLLILFVPITLVLAVLGFVLWFLIQQLLPRRLSSAERKYLNTFTEKLFGIAERARLPYPVLIVLIGKDVIRGRESRFLSRLIGDSKALTRELGEIQAMFED